MSHLVLHEGERVDDGRSAVTPGDYYGHIPRDVVPGGPDAERIDRRQDPMVVSGLGAISFV